MNQVFTATSLTDSDLFEDNIETEFSLDDDIDTLFSQLEKFTPPANMVANIMSAVARLPYQYPQRTESREAGIVTVNMSTETLNPTF